MARNQRELKDKRSITTGAKHRPSTARRRGAVTQRRGDLSSPTHSGLIDGDLIGPQPSLTDATAVEFHFMVSVRRRVVNYHASLRLAASQTIIMHAQLNVSHSGEEDGARHPLLRGTDTCLSSV
ncbi:hypothetical protein EYF80_045117 [Liparis tanakae]|uniref:Uncharacterized protein n=1 Tax=Liparis tanakae TaxID=230148 RepID=A0A4Z2FTZ4_9TELE|nr:hypothetical protein EYF80_045117 [Liparis tanakae]